MARGLGVLGRGLMRRWGHVKKSQRRIWRTLGQKWGWGEGGRERGGGGSAF